VHLADSLNHLHVWTVWKSGSLSLLEPSGSVQACTGIAFPVATNKLHTTGLILQIFCWWSSHTIL